MNALEIITLIIAIYGGVLSTINMAFKIGEKKKKIEVILQHREWVEGLYLIITNHGIRPITINDLQVIEYNEDGKLPFPQQARFNDSDESKKLPMKLNEGETIELRLSKILLDFLYDDQHNFSIQVWDSTGKNYYIDKVERYDTKFGQKNNVTNKFKGKIKKHL